MRAFALGLALLITPLAFVAGPEAAGIGQAHATTSVLMTLEELVSVSPRIAIVVAEERNSRWEEVFGSKRIVTYTKLSIRERLTGEEGDTVWVRTLGGKVDKIGQAVAGEAQFTLGERALVFLTKDGEQAVVSGMAQGHFPLVIKDGDEVLASSPDMGTLIAKRGPRLSARERLVARKVGLAKQDIRSVLEAQAK